VPKAAMHENDPAPGRKYEVGRTGQVAPVKDVAVSEPMEEPSNQHLRFSILTPDPAHDLAAA